MSRRPWVALRGWLVLAAVVAMACGQADPAARAVDDLVVGDCFQAPQADDQVREVEVVDCAVPHDHQVFALVELAGASFPGTAAVQEVAFARCLEQYEEAVGTAYAVTPVDVGLLLPTRDSWDDGDREVVCLLGDGVTPLEGSLLADGV